MVVVGPAGVYCTPANNSMVWLAALKWATHFRQSCDFLANQNGPMKRSSATPGLTASEWSFAHG